MTFYAEIGPAFSSPTRLFCRHSGPPFSVELRTSVIVSGRRSMTDDRTSVRRLLSTDGRQPRPLYVQDRSANVNRRHRLSVQRSHRTSHARTSQPSAAAAADDDCLRAARRGAADADASRFPHRASVPCDDVTAEYAHACVQPEVALITVLSRARSHSPSPRLCLVSSAPTSSSLSKHVLCPAAAVV